MTPTPRADERGLSDSLQWALLAPVVLLAVLGLVQAGVVLHARNSVRQAAMGAAEAEAVLGSRGGDGQAVAARIAAPGVEDVTTTVVRSGGTVTVVVRGRAPVFFDLGMAGVEARAVMPLEVP